MAERGFVLHDIKSFGLTPEFKSDGAEGSVKAAFSVFGNVDRQGDVVVKEAFAGLDGTEIPMVWSHNWDQAIGKGVIRVRDDHAELDGRFLTETQAGREAYLTVKGMGALQQWSFGFKVLDAAPAVKDGQDVRVIKSLEVFEASPVLVGANGATRTLAIKGYGLSFEEHADRVEDALAEFLGRLRAGAALRAEEKVGRPISAARRERMATCAQQVRAAADEIDAMLTETMPPESGKAAEQPETPGPGAEAKATEDLRQQREQFRRLAARMGLPTPLEVSA